MSATETTSPRSGPRARLLLVDISSYFYRAFHAMPDFRSPTGDPTGAIFGVANMLNKLRDEYPADYSACVFDPKGKTFRDDIYPEYKANREKMPEDLAHQVKHIREVAEALGWPCIEVAGMEADDVIGTLTKHAVARGVETIISTGDKDLAQLVEDGVLWYNTMSNEKLGVAGITEKFGVPPDRIIDYLALMGDNVDNVPGVEKVGPKTAAKWIAEFGSLDGVIANAANIKGVVGENLRKALDWLPTGRTLVTVKCDVPLPFDFDTIDHKQRDIPRLDKLYEHFGFKGMRAALHKGVEQPSLPAQAGEGADSAVFKQADKDAGATRWSSGEMAAKQVAFVNTRQYETISTNARLDAWIAKLNAATLACVDTETTSLDPMAAQIVGLSFACVAGEAAYLPLRHIYPGAPISSISTRPSPSSAPGWKMRANQSSARTSNTTCTYSPTTASPCAAMSTTRCCSPTCWKAISGTTWIRWPRATSAPLPFPLNKLPARVPRKLALTRCQLRQPRSIRPKIPMSRCNCMARCIRRSRPTRNSSSSMRTSKCQPPTCC